MDTETEETIREALEELKRLNVHTVMLSGDNTTTAQTIAKQAGIDECHEVASRGSANRVARIVHRSLSCCTSRSEFARADLRGGEETDRLRRPSQRRQNLSGTNGLVADSLFAAVT